MQKRILDICILSDLHLGTFESHAKECLQYIRSIEPKILVLNGDILDLNSSKNKGLHSDQIDLINEVLSLSKKGVKTYYITGNHDEVIRKLEKDYFGNIHVRDKLVLHHNKKSYWIFHGDVFDSSLKLTPFVAKFGGHGYDALLRLNRLVNLLRKSLGLGYVSISKKIKSKVKRGLQLIRDFERVALKLAAEKSFDYVVCGHIHEPKIRTEYISGKEVTYMNSGDWVENLTALELSDEKWSIYKYNELDYALPLNSKLVFGSIPEPKSEKIALDQEEMELLMEFV